MSAIGSQRTTYRLQLPYRYGIPLLIVSSILHWLVSQSVFLARISLSSAGEVGFYSSVSTVGCSCMAIITVICASGIVVFIGILNGFRRYKPGMPLVGSNSAAISVACHRPNEDLDAAYKPVMWGAVKTDGAVGHCCFTSFEVTKPLEGELYAGLYATSESSTPLLPARSE